MVRIATADDINQLLEIYGPYVLHTTHTFEYDVPSRAEFLARFEAITARFPWLVWEEDGAILGYAYGSAPFDRAAYRWCAEDSVYLRPEARGRGIGGKLCRCLEKLLWYQGYLCIYAVITSENQASLDFHRRLGYEFRAEMPGCGIKFGKNLGIIWMEKRRDAVGIPSNFPLSWEEIGKDAQKISDILDILSLS